MAESSTHDTLGVSLGAVVLAYLDKRLARPVIQKVWLDTNEAGEYLSLHPVTLLKFRKQKRGPKWHQRGATIRYLRSEIDAWLLGESASAKEA